jgi:hypothetical protein
MLGIPVGSIGPERARCLERLRRSPHLAQIISQRARNAEVKQTGKPGR